MPQLLDKKLHAAIDKLNDRQKKIVLNITQEFNDENEEEIHHLLNDKVFITEMNKRYDEYANGNSRLISLEEAENKALVMIAKIKRAS